MKIISALTLLIILATFCCSSAHHHHHHHDFVQCLSEQFNSNISNLIYTPNNSSFTSLLLFPIWNLRFTSESTPKPQVIITPDHESQIPPIILCAKQNDVEIRTRSGGHDFEALSSISKVVSFVIIDLIKLSETRVNVEAKTAWVEAGATLGSVYYRIAEKSRTLGFPAGLCATVGVGGHISGGGYGTLMRKYGMAADNVIDARIVDVNGRILDRKSMGEDLFWAIRGGGGASFGVIVAWKLQLVDVPERVTVFSVNRTMEQNLIGLIHRWQYVAPRMDPDITLLINAVVSQNGRKTTLNATFFAVFLGGVDRLLTMMQQSFPELGLVRADCTEMSWIQSALLFDNHPIQTTEALLSRTQPNKSYMKRKTDYVLRPIPARGLQGLTRLYYQQEATLSTLSFVPYGGRMAQISESALPFPNRAGNLYHIFYTVYWQQHHAAQNYLNWLHRAYTYMTPYVSNNPRVAYINYRDLDIGVNNDVGKTSVAQASIWGVRYFKNNFDRLVRVKTKVDPLNFFSNQQSIPPLHNNSLYMNTAHS